MTYVKHTLGWHNLLLLVEYSGVLVVDNVSAILIELFFRLLPRTTIQEFDGETPFLYCTSHSVVYEV